MSAQNASSLAASTDLVYASDYFSFVGADEQGYVAFALDNNRGRDGSAYQVEHFYALLHDERQGWVDVTGVGHYESMEHELLTIPDSSFFQFEDLPATGLTITSAVNHLTLRLKAIPQCLVFAGFGCGSAHLDGAGDRWSGHLRVPGEEALQSDDQTVAQKTGSVPGTPPGFRERLPIYMSSVPS